MALFNRGRPPNCILRNQYAVKTINFLSPSANGGFFAFLCLFVLMNQKLLTKFDEISLDVGSNKYG